jgi:hypothetical protein
MHKLVIHLCALSSLVQILLLQLMTLLTRGFFKTKAEFTSYIITIYND